MYRASSSTVQASPGGRQPGSGWLRLPVGAPGVAARGASWPQPGRAVDLPCHGCPGGDATLL